MPKMELGLAAGSLAALEAEAEEDNEEQSTL
jgi:hypothetical protein